MFTAAAKEIVLATLVGNLSPYVGATMANASVQGFASRLGLLEAHLDRDAVTKLIDALAPGLDVYVGKDKARVVVAAIWASLDALEQRNSASPRSSKR